MIVGASVVALVSFRRPIRGGANSASEKSQVLSANVPKVSCVKPDDSRCSWLGLLVIVALAALARPRVSDRFSAASAKGNRRPSKEAPHWLVQAIVSSLILGLVVSLAGAVVQYRLSKDADDRRTVVERRLGNLQFVRQELNVPVYDGLDLSGQVMIGLDLARKSFRQADLSGALLQTASLVDGDFTLADLSRASLSNTDARRGRFVNARLVEADMAHAQLDGATFSPTRIERVNFSGSSMMGVDLADVELRDVTLSTAALHGARLNGAVLDRVNATAASFVDADFTNVVMSNVYLARTDMRGRGLDTATLINVCYDKATRWPEAFTPPAPKGCRQWSEARLADPTPWDT